MKKETWKYCLIITTFLITFHGSMVLASDFSRDVRRIVVAQAIVSGIRTFPLMPGGATPYWQNPNSPYYQPYYPYYYPYGGYYPGSGANTSPYPTDVKPAGRLFIQIEPLDAQVMVDGYSLKQKDDLTYEVGLFTGTHHVEAQKEGFKNYKVDVDIQPGMGTLITIVLEKLQK
jgi:hypothetical protein